MAHDINLGGTIYISSKHAAEITGYTQDYIGQLARLGAIEAQRVSGLWYVLEDSLKKHKEKSDAYIPEPPRRASYESGPEATVSFDGKDYISASRAAKLTGYSQDYVGQLARSGQVLSRQMGNRWFIDRNALMEHKKAKDGLLAEVQVASVGLHKPQEVLIDTANLREPIDTTHFPYRSDDTHLMPQVSEKKEIEEESQIDSISRLKTFASEEDTGPKTDLEASTGEYGSEIIESDQVNPIPIRIISSGRPEIDSSQQLKGYNPERYLAKKNRTVTFLVSTLTTLAAVGTIVYIGNTMGYFDVLSTLYTSRNEQKEPASELVIQNNSEQAKNLLESLFSKELVYTRSSRKGM